MPPLRLALFLAVSLASWTGREARGAEPPGRLAFRSYGADAGLENHDMSCIFQDGEGFVWACAADAVYRFDGERFERFGLEAGLPSANVRDVTLDAGGRLLLVTQEGVVRWDGSRFVPVPMTGLGSAVSRLRLDAGERMLAGTEEGLYAESEPGRFARVPGWPGGSVEGLWVDASGALQVLSDGRLLSRDVQGRWQIREVPGDASRRLLALARDGAGRLWLGGDGRLVMQAREGAPLEDRSAFVQGMLGAGRRLRVGQRGQLLLPNYKGLLVVEGERAESVRMGLSERSARMWDVLEDAKGTLWVASLGVHRSVGRGLWTEHDAGTGLPSSMPWGLARGPDGTLWVGTDSGLARGTAEGWDVIPGLAGYSLKAVSVAGDGAVWVGGNPLGLHRYEPWSGRLRTFDESSGYPARYTNRLVWDADGSLWAATSSGLIRGTRTGEDWSFQVVIPSPRVTFFGVARDPAGRLWAAGDGLHVREGGVFRRLGTADGLRNDRVRYLVARRDGRLCVSYAEPIGMSCFRYQGGRLVEGLHLDRDTGLHNGMVYMLGEDAAGRLWVGTGAGVHVVRDDGVLEHFGASGGLPADDCTGNSFLADADGGVWVGTALGLGRFEGTRYAGPAEPPRVVPLDTRLGPRAFSQPPGEGLETEHDEATLEVRLADLGVFDERRVEHQARMVGLDDWHAASGRLVRYSSLPAGSYRLEVRARDGRGPWGPVAGFSVTVHPPWWARWWARLLGGVVLGAAVAGVVRWRGLALRRENTELEHLVAARTAELETAREKVIQAEKLSAMGQLLARLSHEINNPLTAIHNNLPPVGEYFAQLAEVLRLCRERLEAHPEDAQVVERVWKELDVDFVLQDTPEALEAMRYATERIRSIQEDLRAFLRGERPRLEPNDLNQTVQETLEVVRRSLPRSARVEVELGEVPRFSFHKGQLGQVLMNLVRNAFDAMGNEGEVRVSTRVRDGRVELVVADDGPGIPMELRARIFEPFFSTKDVGKGSGLGLAICRQIIAENHGGTLELDGTVARGACFRVRLPLVRPGEQSAA